MTKSHAPDQPALAARSAPAPAPAPGAVERPKLVVPLGRGARGKTWWMRWAAERAQNAGRSVVIADADRTNATLTAQTRVIRYFDARTNASEQTARDVAAEIVAALVASRHTAEAEAERFRTGLAATEADTIQRIGQAIAISADKALTRRVRVLDRFHVLAIAGALFGTAIVFASLGYFQGISDGLADLRKLETRIEAGTSGTLAAARDWSGLMSWNDIGAALELCRQPGHTLTEESRRYCFVPLWLEKRADPLPKKPEPIIIQPIR